MADAIDDFLATPQIIRDFNVEAGRATKALNVLSGQRSIALNLNTAIQADTAASAAVKAAAAARVVQLRDDIQAFAATL